MILCADFSLRIPTFWSRCADEHALCRPAYAGRSGADPPELNGITEGVANGLAVSIAEIPGYPPEVTRVLLSILAASEAGQRSSSGASSSP